MADSRMVGNAVRRRMGAPSSHIGMAEGAKMGLNKNGTWSDPSVHGSYDDANVSAALGGYGEGHDRKPVGPDVIGNVYSGPAGANGPYLTPKHNASGAAPAKTQGQRRPIIAERLGARYAISVPMLQQNAPESQLTQGNGKIISSAANRTDANFQGGVDASTGR